MPRATRITIDPSALLQNLQRVRALAPASRVWAVVKADAYGHGLDGLLPSLSQADGLALVEFDRAWRLRQRGWDKPVMMLEGAFDLADTRLAADLSLDLTVHEPRQVEWLKQLDSNSRIAVHLKLNSGMNRLGFTAEDYPRVFSEIRALPQVKSITLMTHFANADVAGGALGTDDAALVGGRGAGEGGVDGRAAGQGQHGARGAAVVAERGEECGVAEDVRPG